MIFTLTAEVLTKMVLKAQKRGFLMVSKLIVQVWGIRSYNLQMTLYFFVDGSLDEARRVRNILVWFEAVSGLKVNTRKTILYK